MNTCRVERKREGIGEGHGQNAVQEYWIGLPFPPPGYLPDPGVEPTSLVYSALAGRFFPTVPPGKPLSTYNKDHMTYI